MCRLYHLILIRSYVVYCNAFCLTFLAWRPHEEADQSRFTLYHVFHMFHIMLRRIKFCGVVRCYTTWPCVRFIYGVGNFDNNNLLLYLYTFFLYRSIFCVLPILLQYLVFVISIFQRKVRLTRDEFEEIFDHYDKVGDPKLLNDVDCKIMIKIMWVNCG